MSGTFATPTVGTGAGQDWAVNFKLPDVAQDCKSHQFLQSGNKNNSQVKIDIVQGDTCSIPRSSSHPPEI